MKFLQILAFFILLCGFSYSVKSQADCRYGLRFIIRDETGKTIENAKLELIDLDSKIKLPAYVKLIRLDDAYVFTSSAGQTVNGNFQLRILADGYSVYEQKINFPICKIQTYAIKLKAFKNTEKSITLSEVAFADIKNAVLSGVLADETGAVVSKTKVTATSSDRKTFNVWTNEDGVYQLEIPIGIYSIEFQAIGFKVYKIEKYKIAPSIKGNMSLDIVLEVRDCDDPLVNCDYITGEPLKNKKKSNKLIKKKGNNK